VTVPEPAGWAGAGEPLLLIPRLLLADDRIAEVQEEPAAAKDALPFPPDELQEPGDADRLVPVGVDKDDAALPGPLVLAEPGVAADGDEAEGLHGEEELAVGHEPGKTEEDRGDQAALDHRRLRPEDLSGDVRAFLQEEIVLERQRRVPPVMIGMIDPGDGQVSASGHGPKPKEVPNVPLHPNPGQGYSHRHRLLGLAEFLKEVAKERPFGYNDPEIFRSTIEILSRYGTLKSPPPLDTVYDNRFVEAYYRTGR